MEINELFNLRDSNFPIKKSENESDVLKHILWRIGSVFGVIAVIFIIAAIIDDDYVMLGAIILSGGLTLILMLFLLIESFILYSNKKNALAKTNLIIVGIFVLMIGVFFLVNF